MESRIAKILNQMNVENGKLKNLKKEYENCQEIRRAGIFRMYANTPDGKYNFIESQLTIEGKLAEKVLDIIEVHYMELCNAQENKLEELVEEMKNGGE